MLNLSHFISPLTISAQVLDSNISSKEELTLEDSSIGLCVVVNQNN